MCKAISGNNGIEVILSGGAVVGIYSNGIYVSRDIDLVNAKFADRREIALTMEVIGFTPAGRHFEHPESDQIIEFPPGPVSIGDEKIEKFNEFKLETGVLCLLSPTDCVKDRLSHYYHWGDQQCLAQAILVSVNWDIDLNDVREWSIREGKEAMFEKISKELEG